VFLKNHFRNLQAPLVGLTAHEKTFSDTI